jgi:hypothetical protein
MRQHRGSTADRRALHRNHDRLLHPGECIHKAGLRRFARPGRILEEIADVIAGEGVARAVPEDDTTRSTLSVLNRGSKAHKRQCKAMPISELAEKGSFMRTHDARF